MQRFLDMVTPVYVPTRSLSFDVEAQQDAETPRLFLHAPDTLTPPPATPRTPGRSGSARGCCERAAGLIRPALCAAIGVTSYAGLVYLWYQGQVAQARPQPFRLGDMEYAASRARLLWALTPCAGFAGAMIGAQLPTRLFGRRLGLRQNP